MMYLFCLLLLFVPFAVFEVRWAYHRRLLVEQSWETVLARVEHVDLEGIRAIAECYLIPDRNQLHIEPNEMWRLLGGLDGINRLSRNASAMVDLAVYAQRWNDVEGGAVTEMIRRDAARLQSAVRRLQLTSWFGYGFVRAPFHVQEAAAAYYLMRSRLIGLYQNSHEALLPQLQYAL